MLEGKMLQDLLQQEGIGCYLGGSSLQGAIGELPASGLIRLFVNANDFSRAQYIIKGWMAASPLLDD
jgi:Putative prokaryotic signal transducing protein